jgi:hypothetical protein
MRRVGLWLINSGVDHWRQFVALLQCLPPAERAPRGETFKSGAPRNGLTS